MEADVTGTIQSIDVDMSAITHEVVLRVVDVGDADVAHVDSSSRGPMVPLEDEFTISIAASNHPAGGVRNLRDRDSGGLVSIVPRCFRVLMRPLVTAGTVEIVVEAIPVSGVGNRSPRDGH